MTRSSAARSENGARQGAPPSSLGCWLTKHLPAAPAALLEGARPVRPEWAQQSASIRIMLGGLSLFPDLERYYKSSILDPIVAAIWFTSTTKKSHAYVTVIDGLIILDHEEPSRASGFHSNYHIDDKSPRALP
ncbi:hypothetical protein FXO38_03711 [Capsicum annuum]|nr:hypothetical protein FXO38_03711 [Capsicum annuum]KAF3679961.1 hypothetical protein FXO37_03581 [Capsicum annuum]